MSNSGDSSSANNQQTGNWNKIQNLLTAISSNSSSGTNSNSNQQNLINELEQVIQQNNNDNNYTNQQQSVINELQQVLEDRNNEQTVVNNIQELAETVTNDANSGSDPGYGSGPRLYGQGRNQVNWGSGGAP